MKKILYFPLFISIAGFVLLFVLIQFTGLSGIKALPLILSLLGLLAAGVSCFLLQDKPTGFLKTAGIVLSLSGFIFWTLAVFQVMELKSYWHIGLGLMAMGLIAGIHSVVDFSSSLLKTIAALITVVFVLIQVGILFKTNQMWFYGLGMISLVLFSILAILASVVRKK